MTTTKSTHHLPEGFIPLDQLGAHVSDTQVCVERARQLYEAAPTALHLENLRETEREHKLAMKAGR